MITTKSTGESYETLTSMMDNHKKVYYSRFGDGDINIMVGARDKMHDPSPELSAELQSAFFIDHPQYLKALGTNYPIERHMRPRVFGDAHGFSGLNDVLVRDLNVMDGVYESLVMFHYFTSFKPELMVSFLDTYIRSKKKLYIGSVPQADAEKLLGKIDYFVEVPFRNAYYEMKNWWEDILKVVDDVEVVIPCAGMAGRLVNGRLWNLDKQVHSIDIGATIDMVGGRSTRSWHDLVGMKVAERIIIK